MSGQSPTVSERLALLLARPVSDEDRARARLHLLDWCACAVAGLAEPAVQPVMRLVAREGSGPCRVLGGLRSGPLAAVLVNGPLGAVLEMDDVDKRALLHPGPVVVPAALAVAEVAGIIDGDALLDAIVRGYEAMIRVGRAAGASHYRNHHATGTCGTFGAAAAGASLLGLDPTRTAWALGAAGQQAAGLWQVRHEPGLMKAFHDGRAASNGVAGALLASDGFVAPLRVFEGPQGFFAALAPEGDPEAILTGEGDPWRLWDVSFKPHAACRHAHPAIDAALELRRRLDGRTPERVLVESYRDALLFCDRPEPATVTDAKFSLQHAVSVALLHGDAGLERFTMDAVAEPSTAAMRSKVEAREGEAFTARYPGRFGAALTATLASGETLTAQADDALGDPENPVSEGDLLAKAEALLNWGDLPDPARLIEAALQLGRTHDIPAFSAALPGETG